MFIGRSSELALLEKAYASKTAQLVVVYGRRRVGKSALIAQFLKSKPHVVTCEALEDQDTPGQLQHFSRRMAQQLHEPLLDDASLKDWDRAFGFLTRNALDRATAGAKLVIFLDELQWMAVGKGALVSLLKFYWDNHWKQHQVMLILCGSVSSFMVNRVLRSKALYGRTTLELKLRGLQPHEASELLGSRLSPEEVLKYLLVFGAIPKYLEQIDVRRSFSQNLNAMCFSKNGCMVNEADKIFHSQFRVPQTYFRIMKLLTDVPRTLKDVGTAAHIRSGGGLSGYLDNLVIADFIMPYVPFDKTDGGKSMRYSMCDEFLHFYLKYMKPHMRTIEQSHSSKVFEALTGNSIDSWFGFAFERFCHKHAGRLATQMGFGEEMIQAAPLFRKEDPGFQIDLLFKRSDKVIVICEIKHAGAPVTTAIIPEVQRKCALLFVPRGYSVRKALVSLYGPDKALAESEYFDYSVTLKEIFAP